MTVILDLPAHVEQAYLAEAAARGLPLDEVVREVLVAAKSCAALTASTGRESAPPFERGTSADLGADRESVVLRTSSTELSPEEWVREFQAWTRSHAGENLPLLSDETISRESIHRERGL